MAFATAVNIADRLGRDLTEKETRIVEARLDDAEVMIQVRIPDLAYQVSAGNIPEPLLVMIEADMLLRVIRNPEGYRSENDGNYSYEIDSRVASGQLSVLPEEWGMLGLRSSITVLSTGFDLSHWSDRRSSQWPFEVGQGLYE